MKTLLIAICFAFALPTFTSKSNATTQKLNSEKILQVEIGDNPPQPDPKPKG